MGFPQGLVVPSPIDFLERVERATVVVAHPDDEALMFGGTMRTLADAGAEVTVVSVSDGGQGRGVVFHEACSRLGATGRILGLNAGSIALDLSLIAEMDEVLSSNEPDVVFTHGGATPQHQDHLVVRNALELSLARWTPSVLALGGEVPVGRTNWRPQVFVDITSNLPTKVEAVELYAELGMRQYLTRDAVRTRAAYWGLLGYGSTAIHAEAFDLLVWT